MINEAYLRGREEQDFQQAERVLERARKKFPDEEIVLNELAKVAYALGRRGDAREFWEKSLAMKEGQMEVHERLGLLLETDLPDEARSTCAAPPSSAPRRPASASRSCCGPTTACSTPPTSSTATCRKPAPTTSTGTPRRACASAWTRCSCGSTWRSARCSSLLISIPAWQVYRRLRGASLAQLLRAPPRASPRSPASSASSATRS
jgi:tetratricopeptide (TPR) repeat protein